MVLGCWGVFYIAPHTGRKIVWVLYTQGFHPGL